MADLLDQELDEMLGKLKEQKAKQKEKQSIRIVSKDHGNGKIKIVSQRGGEANDFVPENNIQDDYSDIEIRNDDIIPDVDTTSGRTGRLQNIRSRLADMVQTGRIVDVVMGVLTLLMLLWIAFHFKSVTSILFYCVAQVILFVAKWGIIIGIIAVIVVAIRIRSRSRFGMWGRWR